MFSVQKLWTSLLFFCRLRPVDRDFERGVTFINTRLARAEKKNHRYTVAARSSTGELARFTRPRGNFFRVVRVVRCSNIYITHKLALHSPHVY